MGTNLSKIGDKLWKMGSKLSKTSRKLSDAPDPDGFSMFGTFPKETRLLIWEQAIEDLPPDFVSLKHYNNPARFLHGYFATESSGNVPALLHVNSEARAMALKAYPPMSLSVYPSSKPQYFNVDRYSLVLGAFHHHDIPASGDFGLIKHIIAYLPRDLCCHVKQDVFKTQLLAGGRMHHWTHYTGLETLTIVDSEHPHACCNPPCHKDYEMALQAAIVSFWKQKMNAKQLALGKAITEPPRVSLMVFPRRVSVIPDAGQLFRLVRNQRGF